MANKGWWVRGITALWDPGEE